MRVFDWIKAGFLTGLVVIVPFGLSLLFLYKLSIWIYSFVSAAPSRALTGLFESYELPVWVFKTVSFSLGMLFTVFVVVLAGYTAKNIIGNRLVKFTEGIILRIPIIRIAYNAAKQILNTLFVASDIRKSGRVAMFEYPKEGVYSIGFLTSKMEPGQGHNILDETVVTLFVPTTPNPTSGFYVMVPEAKVTELPLSVEQAFNIIISGGFSSSSED